MDLAKLAEYLAWLVQSEIPWANAATREASLTYLQEMLGPLAASHEGARGTLEDLAAILERSKGQPAPVAELRGVLQALLEDPNPRWGLTAPAETIEAVGRGGQPGAHQTFPAALDPRLEEALRGKLVASLPTVFQQTLAPKPGEPPAAYLQRLVEAASSDAFEPEFLSRSTRWAEAVKAQHPDYAKTSANDLLTSLLKGIRQTQKPGEQGLTHLLMLNLLGRAGQERLPGAQMQALFGPPELPEAEAPAAESLEQLIEEQAADDPRLGKDLGGKSRRRRSQTAAEGDDMPVPIGERARADAWLQGAEPLTTKEELRNFHREFFERLPRSAPKGLVSVLKLRGQQDPEGWAMLVRVAVQNLAEQEKRGEATKVRPTAPVGTTWTELAELVGQGRLGVLLDSGRRRPEGGHTVHSTLLKEIIQLHQQDMARTQRNEPSRFWIGLRPPPEPPPQPTVSPEAQAAMLRNAAQKGAPTMADTSTTGTTTTDTPTPETPDAAKAKPSLLQYLRGFTEKQRANTPEAWTRVKKGPERLKALGQLAITPAGILTLLLARPALSLVGSLLGIGGGQAQFPTGMSLSEYQASMHDLPSPDELALMARAEQVRRQQQLAQALDPRLQAALSQLQFNRGVPGSTSY